MNPTQSEEFEQSSVRRKLLKRQLWRIFLWSIWGVLVVAWFWLLATWF